MGVENKALVVKSKSEDIDKILTEYADGMTDEDRAIHQAYEELAKGEKVIDITQALTNRKMGTTWRATLPAVAVAPATVSEVDLEVGFNDEKGTEYARLYARVGSSRTGMFGRAIAREWELRLPPGEVYDFSNVNVRSADYVWRTQVPHVPLRIRKEFDITDPDRIILFEVEDWTKVKSRVETYPPPPAADPALLKRVTGNLYKVETTWEFTDLELQVIAGIRSAK